MFGFRSKITIKVLRYFLLNRKRRHYVNELADLLAVDPGNLFRKLKELESEGILVSEMQGNQRYFKLNKKYPLLRELEHFFRAKYGIEEMLKQKLSKLKGLREAYIFGSYAKNSLQQESDIDLLLIGDHSSLEAKKLILSVAKEIQREINIVDFSSAEFKKKKKAGDDFLKNIFSHKKIKIM
ncbi:MAG: nucleotidyltransferase domain-containing protein [Patescibacteria group bacterium]|nr:nucleotidyltransferase domain-containing protein [Patescibacteria group bacterium]